MKNPALRVVPSRGCDAQIISEMQAAGIEAPPTEIIADGGLHRFASVPGKKGATGWYVVHPDPVAPIWSFGDWRLGIKQNGEGDPGRVLDAGEISDRKERIRDLRNQVAAEEKKHQAGAAIEARQRWDKCAPATAAHGYLKLKRVDPCGTRQEDDLLLVPMRDITGKLWSLQEIAPDGRKHNQEGGRRKACFHLIGEVGEVLCVAEGFATGATIHKATGYAVASAGEAGNLECVAKALRGKYPDVAMVICSDDDWLTKHNGRPHNTGKLAATKAAEAVGGVLALPWFGPARPAWATDFNDMEKLCGAEEVATCIRLARVKHEEDRQAAPTAMEGLAEGDDAVAFSEDALALRFAAVHGDTIRFVAPWSKWQEWNENRWNPDEKLRAMSMSRNICRQAAKE